MVKNEPIDVAAALILVRGASAKHGVRMLLQQRAPRREFPLVWEMPGGKIEHGESGPETVRRELREELSIDVGEVHPRVLTSVAFDPPLVQFAVNVTFYVVHLDIPRVLKEVVTQDAIGVGLFTLADTQSLDCMPSCYPVIEQIGRMGGLEALLGWGS